MTLLPESSTKRKNLPLFDTELPSYGGLQVAYYTVCKRKLWLFSHGISMESENENVKLGKLLHEDSYERKAKDILIDNKIRVDFIDGGSLHEVKKSSRLEEASENQILYYLYYLSLKGIFVDGELHYPKENRVKKVTLDEDAREKIESIISHIDEILKMPSPPSLDSESKPYCRKCAYYDFCYG